MKLRFTVWKRRRRRRRKLVFEDQQERQAGTKGLMLIEGLFDGSPSIGFVNHYKKQNKNAGHINCKTDLLTFNITYYLNYRILSHVVPCSVLNKFPFRVMLLIARD